MVVWIIGKSGVGKSYLAKKIFNKLRLKKKVIWIDGDKFRKKYSADLGYSIRDRRSNSIRMQNLFELWEQKYLVICSVLSIFPKHQKENRKIINKYLQILITAEQKKLIERNNKKIYSKNKNVVGKDIKFPKPYKSNLIIKNDFDKNFLKQIKKIEKIIYYQL